MNFPNQETCAFGQEASKEIIIINLKIYDLYSEHSKANLMLNDLKYRPKKMCCQRPAKLQGQNGLK